MKKLTKNEMKMIMIMGGTEPVSKCKELGATCSSNDDCGGAKNYCYCRLKGVGCM